eukprot:1994296-Pyramimonas_sp.AAC.1
MALLAPTYTPTGGGASEVHFDYYREFGCSVLQHRICVGHYSARFGRRPARPASKVSLEREGLCAKCGHSRT